MKILRRDHEQKKLCHNHRAVYRLKSYKNYQDGFSSGNLIPAFAGAWLAVV